MMLLGTPGPPIRGPGFNSQLHISVFPGRGQVQAQGLGPTPLLEGPMLCSSSLLQLSSALSAMRIWKNIPANENMYAHMNIFCCLPFPPNKYF